MKRTGLIEVGTMFNSTKPKTRPANCGARLDLEENPGGALRARYFSFLSLNPPPR